MIAITLGTFLNLASSWWEYSRTVEPSLRNVTIYLETKFEFPHLDISPKAHTSRNRHDPAKCEKEVSRVEHNLAW